MLNHQSASSAEGARSQSHLTTQCSSERFTVRQNSLLTFLRLLDLVPLSLVRRFFLDPSSTGASGLELDNCCSSSLRASSKRNSALRVAPPPAAASTPALASFERKSEMCVRALAEEIGPPLMMRKCSGAGKAAALRALSTGCIIRE